MDPVKILILLLAAAAIGWLFNSFIAGLLVRAICRQKSTAARSIGAFAANELLNADMLKEKIKDPALLADVRPSIEHHVNHFLHEKLKEKLPVIPTFVGKGTLDKIKEGLMEEIDLLFPEVLGKMADNLGAQLNIQQVIERKISNLSDDQIVSAIRKTFSKELLYFRLVGAMGGLIIAGAMIVLNILF